MRQQLRQSVYVSSESAHHGHLLPLLALLAAQPRRLLGWRNQVGSLWWAGALRFQAAAALTVRRMVERRSLKQSHAALSSESINLLAYVLAIHHNTCCFTKREEETRM